MDHFTHEEEQQRVDASVEDRSGHNSNYQIYTAAVWLTNERSHGHTNQPYSGKDQPKREGRCFTCRAEDERRQEQCEKKTKRQASQ